MICRYECTVIHAEGNSLSDSGHIVSYIQRVYNIQKTTADSHSQHLLLVEAKSRVCILRLCLPLSALEERVAVPGDWRMGERRKAKAGR